MTLKNKMPIFKSQTVKWTNLSAYGLELLPWTCTLGGILFMRGETEKNSAALKKLGFFRNSNNEWLRFSDFIDRRAMMHLFPHVEITRVDENYLHNTLPDELNIPIDYDDIRRSPTISAHSADYLGIADLQWPDLQKSGMDAHLLAYDNTYIAVFYGGLHDKMKMALQPVQIDTLYVCNVSANSLPDFCERLKSVLPYGRSKPLASFTIDHTGQDFTVSPKILSGAIEKVQKSALALN